jgi:hypothetical protein
MKRGFLDLLDPFNDPEFFWQVISGPPCIVQSRTSFCASPSCRPQLRFGLQSLGLAKKESLLLLKI